jgi:hypothetical protein
VSNTLDIETIGRRLKLLGQLEATARPLVLGFGMTEWPLGDAIKVSLADAQSLVARVAELEAAAAAKRDEPGVVRALVGALRAEGYVIREPGRDKEPNGLDQSLPMLYDPRTGLWGAEPATADKWRAYHGQEAWIYNPWTGTRRDNRDVGTDVLGLLIVPSRPMAELLATAAIEKVQGEMLGEDEPDDYGPEDPNPMGAGVIVGTPASCPSCEQPLPPDGKCRSSYVDCQKGTALKPLELGTSLRVVGGLWDGRYAIATGELAAEGARHCVQIAARGVDLANAAVVEVGRIYVVNPTVDEPIVKTGPIQPPDNASAASPVEPARKRAEEPPVAIADWSLADKDLTEVAAKLGRTVDEVKRLVTAFKVTMKDRAPTPRWRPAFTAWATKNAAAVLAQATIPGA